MSEWSMAWVRDSMKETPNTMIEKGLAYFISKYGYRPTKIEVSIKDIPQETFYEDIPVIPRRFPVGNALFTMEY